MVTLQVLPLLRLTTVNAHYALLVSLKKNQALPFWRSKVAFRSVHLADLDNLQTLCLQRHPTEIANRAPRGHSRAQPVPTIN